MHAHMLFLVCLLPCVLCFLPRLTVLLPALHDVHLSAQREVQVQPPVRLPLGDRGHIRLRHTPHRSGRMAGTALRQKGLTKNGVKFFARFIQETGVRMFINKSDEEPVMKAFKRCGIKGPGRGREHFTRIVSGRPPSKRRHRVHSEDVESTDESDEGLHWKARC